MSAIRHAGPNPARNDIDRISATAKDSLTGQYSSIVQEWLASGVAAELERSNDYPELEEKVRLLIDSLDACRIVLQGALNEAIAAENAYVNRERFGKAWQKRQQREISEEFQKGLEKGRARWLATYMESLNESRFDICHEMTFDDWLSPGGSDALKDWPMPGGLTALRTGASALREGRYLDAVEGLEMLARAERGVVEDVALAAVLVLLGRIYLYKLSSLPIARERVEIALELAPGDGRPMAALGECLRAGKDLDRAQECFVQAIQISPSLPDGHIGMAMLCEDQQRWFRAFDYYEDAINESGEQAQFGQLLAPTPAGLYWQLSRHLSKRNPAAALAAIDRALALGVRWRNDYPERLALAERAAILKKLGRREEAADSYFEAGRRYSWLGNAERARTLLKKSCKLDPTHALAHWQLSDTLRLLSYGQSAPFVDAALVKLSLDEWEMASALQHPDVNTAWVYLSRALLNEQRYKLSKDPGLWWESAAFLERALLLNSDYATAWAYLGACHRQLGNYSSALQATEQAISFEPVDVAGLGERAAILAELGRYAESEELIDRRLAVAEEWWIVHLKAYVLLRTGQAEQALSWIGRAVDAVPDDENYRLLRALCYRHLGRIDLSQEDYRWLWDRRGTLQGAQWQPAIAAEAGYMLGKLGEAARICKAAIEQRSPGSPELWCRLGLVQLARGDPSRDDVAQGEASLERGIGLVHHPGRLHDLLDLDLEELERRLGDQPGVKQALARIRSRVAEADEALSRSPVTPEEELRAVAQGEPANAARPIAVQAALARSAAAAGRWREALDAYATLQTLDTFPETSIGMSRAICRLQEEADGLVGAGEVAEARERLRVLVAHAEKQLDCKAQVLLGLHLRVAFASLTLSDDETAHQHLDQVLSGRRVPGETELDELPALEQSFIRSPADYWTHVDGLRRLRESYVPGSPQRAVIEALAGRLDLSRLYRLTAGDARAFPIPTPLALRLGPDLKPEDTAASDSLRRELTGLQARVERDTGIRIPAVRLGESQMSGPGDYAILVNGIPVASGSVPVDSRFLLRRHIGHQMSAREAREPLSGEWGVWVEQEERLGDVPQLGPLAFVVRHLEATVRRGLAFFIGADDGRTWLDLSPEDVSAAARIALPDRSARVALTRVLQILAREGVPLTAPTVVLKAMQGEAQGIGALKVATAVRRQLRKSLPGNAPGTRLIYVPKITEERLAAGLRRSNGAVYWQLPRAEAVRLFRDLCNIDVHGFQGAKTALVVKDGDLRPFVRRLVAGELPYLSVLSEEEVVDQDR